ncbi:MAG: hypothetical protein R3F02_16275 [Thiolinea sp.]
MKRQVHSLLLIFLLIVHFGEAMAMATQMQVAGLVVSVSETSDQTQLHQSHQMMKDGSSVHCPHAAQSSPLPIPDTGESDSSCDNCTDCFCISAIGSVLMTPIQSHVRFEPTRHNRLFLPSSFQDSPPGSILRPPIA